MRKKEEREREEGKRHTRKSIDMGKYDFRHYRKMFHVNARVF